MMTKSVYVSRILRKTHLFSALLYNLREASIRYIEAYQQSEFLSKINMLLCWPVGYANFCIFLKRILCDDELNFMDMIWRDENR